MPKWIREVVTCARCKRKVYLKNAVDLGNKYYGRECWNKLSQEEREKAAAQKKLQVKPEIPKKPRIDPYTLRSATEIAQEIGTTARKLNAFLLEKGVLEKNEVCYEPTKAYKFLDDEQYIDIYVGINYASLKWTPKGREWLKEFWYKNQ